MPNLTQTQHYIHSQQKEIDRLRNEIDCACNALTDSIKVSGNDPKTNMRWVRKLRKAINN